MSLNFTLCVHLCLQIQPEKHSPRFRKIRPYADHLPAEVPLVFGEVSRVPEGGKSGMQMEKVCKCNIIFKRIRYEKQ